MGRNKSQDSGFFRDQIKPLFVAALVFSFIPSALPCANFVGKGTKYNGEKSSSGHPKADAIQLRAALQKALMTDGAALAAELRNATEFTNRSDYCVALMYLGRSSEATERLQKLEKEKPGEYYIASNLGTAYELSGNNEEALRWIMEGIRRNPNSHEGTEWLHAKILQAKIAQKKDPAFFEKNSVLGLAPSQITDSIDIDGRHFEPKQVAEAIQHQLEERLQFVKPPDPAVASLLFDYAVIEAVTRSMESARRILNLAGEYGYPRNKIQSLNEDFSNRLTRRLIKDYIAYAFWGAVVIVILWQLHRREIFVLSRKHLKQK